MTSNRSHHAIHTMPIAIIGMAGSFPGASRVDHLWRNLIEGRDAISEVPSHRWPPYYFDPASDDTARFYANRGGFIDANARFEALRFGVMPRAVEGAEPDQLMTLQVCAEALNDAGYAARPVEEGVGGRGFSRAETQVIIGRGGYIGAAMNSLNLRVRTAEQLMRILEQRGWGDVAERTQLREEFLSHIRPFGPDTAIGLVPNLCASRVADRLGLGGAAYTVDAACASSLIAVRHACEALVHGQASLALAGGVHLVHDLTFWAVFSQLGALSRRQRISPFDANADGLLIGEAVGAVVLKRLDEALRDGDRIYSVIRGIGVSSDGGRASLMSPDSGGQSRAIRDAWSGLDSSVIGLLEAHGTGTAAGDLAELTSTLEVLGGQGSEVGLGSIKSNLGHTMPAAGIAGLIKASLAIYHGVKPPTLNVETPHTRLQGTRFKLIQQAESWDDSERWAGVSAFGFGGINAHLALSQSPRFSPLRPRVSRLLASSIVVGVAAESAQALAHELSQLAHSDADSLARSIVIGRGAHRVAIIDPTPDTLREAARLVSAQKTRQGRKGIWINDPSQGLAQSGSLAVMFPGIEATFAPQPDTLCARHGVPTPELFPPESLGERGVSVIRLGLTLYQCFTQLGLSVDHILGHSIGEWAGAVCAGYLDAGEIEPFIAQLDPQGLEVPEVVFIAVGASSAQAARALCIRLNEIDQEALPDTSSSTNADELSHATEQHSRDLEILASRGIFCSHDNCPHQSIFCLPPHLAERVTASLKESQILAQELPFRSGFHAPHFAPFAQVFTDHLRTLSLRSPTTQLWSATTHQVYPQHAEDFYELSHRHLVEPVRFRALIERLYNEGARVFVQLGLGSLSSFVSDTLRGRPHRVIDAHSERRSGWSQWLNLAATLFIEGYDVHFDHLSPAGVRSSRSLKLDLGSALVEISADQATASTARNDDENGGSEDHKEQSSTAVNTQDYTHVTQPKSEPSTSRPLDVGAHRGVATYPSPLRPVDSRPRALREDDQSTLINQPAEWAAIWTLNIKQFPYLRDHCFFRQPPHWTELSDLFPVVPMTLSIQWVMEVAQQLADERGAGRVVGVSEVRAAKWIEIEPAQEVEVNARWRDEHEVHVTIKGHLSARAQVVTAPLAPPEIPWVPFEAEQSSPLRATDIYTERWMFHGEAYQGIDALIGIAPKGIRGVIRHDDTPGALLDNVGQLFGLWVMLTQSVDRVVMPVRLERVQFYGPPPPRGAQLPCAVQIEELGRREVKARMVLWHEGQVWATFAGWRDWRFETSGTLWGLMRYPEHNLYSAVILKTPELHVTLAEGVASSASSREFLVGRCLNRVERAEYRAMNLRRQRSWLAGRIAAKDAARIALWSRGAGSIYPIEIGLKTSQPDTPPAFELSVSKPLQHARPHVSISHRLGLAVAATALDSTVVKALGVDLELVTHQSAQAEAQWREASFSQTEHLMIEHLPQERQRDAYATMWVSKEAAAKTRSAQGLVSGLGSPKRWQITRWSPQAHSKHTTSDSVYVTLEIPTLASGRCEVRHQDDSERVLISHWWIFERAECRWALSLTWSG